MVILFYALNNNHTLEIQIDGRGTKITKKLIDNIKILETKNYSSYTTSKVKDGVLTGTLKKYLGFDKTKLMQVTLKLPDKYKSFHL